MTTRHPPRAVVLRAAVLGFAAWAAATAAAVAQETVNVTVPPAISFPVSDVSRSTAGAPGSVRMSFSDANLDPGKALRVSLQADASAFTSPGGPGIPASNVSWTTLGASGGTGWNGTLSSSSYGLVFESNPVSTSGSVDLAWAMAAPGSGIRAGMHQVTIRWKVEAVTP